MAPNIDFIPTWAIWYLSVAAIVIVGRLLLRPLFRLVASTASHELFVAAALFVIVGSGVAAASSTWPGRPRCRPAT